MLSPWWKFRFPILIFYYIVNLLENKALQENFPAKKPAAAKKAAQVSPGDSPILFFSLFVPAQGVVIHPAL